MRKIFLLVLLTFSLFVNAGDFGIIEGFSIKNVPLHSEPSTKTKLETVPREQIPIPIRIEGVDKKYYRISYKGESVWVKKRHVVSSDIKVDCLALSSGMNTHVAGSKALARPEC